MYSDCEKTVKLLLIAALVATWSIASAGATTSSIYSISDGKVTLKTWDDTATGPVILKVFPGTEVAGGLNYSGAALIGVIDDPAILKLGVIPADTTHLVVGARVNIIEGIAPHVTIELHSESGAYQLYSGLWASLVWEDRSFEIPAELIGKSVRFQARINNPFTGDGHRVFYVHQIQLARVPNTPDVWRPAIEL